MKKPKPNPNLLKGTTTYLVGHMQYGDGTAWRDYVKEEFEDMGIRCFDPYHKPFLDDVDESTLARAKLLKSIEEGEFESVTKRMKKVRGYDLNLVDRCDFITAYLDITIPTCGTWEEIFWANRLKKPVFLVVAGGKKKTPLWLFGTMPHKYIYDNFHQVVGIIKSIDNGTKKLDSNRWRLLRPEYR